MLKSIKTIKPMLIVTLVILLGVFVYVGLESFSQFSIKQLLAGVISFDTKLTTDSSKCSPKSVHSATFIRALDGDTIEVNGYCNTKVRLLYLDTPETVKPNTPVQCYGPEASKHTKKEFTKNQTIYLQTDKEAIDRYGRSLAILYEDKSQAEAKNIKTSYNYELVEQGYAKAKFYSPNTTYKKELEQADKEAKEAKKGQWDKCN
jgi:micrococcal nuclease